jgi:hypothetical protein
VRVNGFVSIFSTARVSGRFGGGLAVKAEGTVAEVLADEARFAVVCGDAVEVMRTLPDGCAASPRRRASGGR